MAQPGWYADPAGRYPHRFWDGMRWTDHVASPAGQGIDPLAPATPVNELDSSVTHQPAPMPGSAQQTELPQQTGHSQQAGNTHQGIRCNPAELHGVLSELGIRPTPAGDGTPFGEPVLVLAFSADRPDALEWWTPAGLLVAVATIIEKQNPGSLDVPRTDPGSGAMVGSHIEVTRADGTPIATTVRTLKPAKPPTFLDDPQGRRLAAVAQEKMFSKIPSHAVTAPGGTSLGRFVGTDMRGRAMVLSDPSGMQLATVVKNGKWDGANVALEFARNRPFQTPSQWLANRAVSALLPIKRERVCSVLISDRTSPGPLPALLTFMAPLLLEHTLSIL